MDYEYTYLGKYGAKGEKRAARIKPTPEQIAKQNHTNKVKKSTERDNPKFPAVGFMADVKISSWNS